MASGKSTIGPILANTLGWNFIDLDQLIEAKVGQKIKSIFEENGEEHFRDLERKTLQEILTLNKYIIALGGGTITDPKNLEMIKSSGFLVYLESSPEEAYKRLRFKRDRPVLLFDSEQEPTKTELLGRITELLKQRQKYYDQPNIRINTDNSRIGNTVDKLASIINK